MYREMIIGSPSFFRFERVGTVSRHQPERSARPVLSRSASVADAANAEIRVDQGAGVSGAREPAGETLSKHSESKGTCCSHGS